MLPTATIAPITFPLIGIFAELICGIRLSSLMQHLPVPRYHRFTWKSGDRAAQKVLDALFAITMRYCVIPAFFRSPALKMAIDDGSRRRLRAAEMSAGVSAAIFASMAAS